jgi:ABC-type polysaccharide/polyol phosphate export permease
MRLSSEAPASFRSTAIRPGPAALVRQGWADLLSRRRLIGYLVRASLKKKGADTLLGNVWWVVDPLLQMLVYVVLVSVIFRRAQADYPLFIFAAILPWKWFSSAIGDATLSVVASERLIKQIAFPKLVLPVSTVFSGIASFAFGLIPLVAMMAIAYADRLSVWLLAIPIVAAVQLLFTLPLAIALAAINVFYRDVGNLSRHVLRLWFYLSPGIYGIDLILTLSKDYPIIGTLMQLNPFAILFTAYRDAIYEGRAPDWQALAALALVSVALLGLATWMFKRVEPMFAKVL